MLGEVFSGNSGKPNEVGLYNDAAGAIKWLKSRGVTEENIILYGESLGTGVAIEVAQNKNYAGVILESPLYFNGKYGKKNTTLFFQFVCYLRINLKVIRRSKKFLLQY